MSAHAHSHRATLIDALLPVRSAIREIALAVAFSLLIAASAQVTVPLWFTPVPVTGQTFAVLLTGALLGSRRGAATVLLYLIEGGAGLPFFARGASGIAPFTGPTGGYLLGFVVAAYATGFLSERGWDRRVWTAAVAMLVGEVAIYACGLPWLAMFVGAKEVWMAGLVPFIPGDLVKLALAATGLPVGWLLTGLRRGS